MSNRVDFSKDFTRLPSRENTAKVYEAVSSLSGLRGPLLQTSTGNYSIAEPQPEGFWAQITDRYDNGGVYYYSWSATANLEGQVVQVLSDGPHGVVEALPAFEANNALVPVGTNVWMRWTPDNATYFLYEGQNEDGTTAACELASLQAGDCLRAVSGDQEVFLYRDSDRWISIDVMDYPLGDGILEFWFANGTLHLSLDGNELLWCGNNCFSGGPLTGHAESLGSGSGGYEACEGETFTVCVSCTCCPIENWAGPGWYCIEDSGPGDCIPVELLDVDRCDEGIVICSGPYEDEAEATAACTPVESAPCQDEDMAAATVTFHDTTGDCSCLETEGAVTIFDTDVDYLRFGTISCPGNIVYLLHCSGGEYTLSFLSGGGSASASVIAFTASPFSLTFLVTGYGSNCGSNGGTARVTIEL